MIKKIILTLIVLGITTQTGFAAKKSTWHLDKKSYNLGYNEGIRIAFCEQMCGFQEVNKQIGLYKPEIQDNIRVYKCVCGSKYTFEF